MEDCSLEASQHPVPVLEYRTCTVLEYTVCLVQYFFCRGHFSKKEGRLTVDDMRPSFLEEWPRQIPGNKFGICSRFLFSPVLGHGRRFSRGLVSIVQKTSLFDVGTFSFLIIGVLHTCRRPSVFEKGPRQILRFGARPCIELRTRIPV